MNSDKNFDRLIRMYASARINKNIFSGTSMELENGRCTLSFDLTEDFHHAMGAAHGSVYFKLLDDSAFFAAQTVASEFFIVTASFNINLIRPVVQGKLRAVGTVRHRTRQTIIAESVLYNEENKEIAFGSGTFMPSKAKLTEASGYSD